MSVIVKSALAGFTAAYNTVQFGGSDAEAISVGPDGFKSTPPMYAFRSEFRYDDTRRNIIGIDHTLTVRCVVFESSHEDMSLNMIALRTLLGTPGKTLTLTGLGTGFGEIKYPTENDYWDIDNGPKPISLEIQPIGNLAWELTWVVTFFISECASSGTDPLAWTAFNFKTTWQNDFEGFCTRTISGYIQIAQIRNSTLLPTVWHTADETRGSLLVSLPNGFRRIQNSWQESTDKSRLDFTIVDEQLPGDNLPAGVTEANGAMSYHAEAGIKNASMVQGIASFTMSIRTAPNQPKNLAGFLFLIAALNKQIELTTDDAGVNRGLTVIPVAFSITNAKFHDSRQTVAMMAWLITGSLEKNLAACNLWRSVNDTLTKAPLGNDLGAEDYTAWLASMAALWNNHGVSGIGSKAGESQYVNLCNNKTIGTIGVSVPAQFSVYDATLPTLACPTLPVDGDGNVLATAGWLHYRLEVEIKRVDHQTTHRRAAIPNITSSPQQTPGALPGPTVSQAPTDNHVAEKNGYPTVYVAVKFAGMRYGARTIYPQLGSVGGVEVDEIKDYVTGHYSGDKIAFDVFGCKVYRSEGYSIYRLRGVPSQLINPVGTVLTTSTPLDPTHKLNL